MTIYIYNSASMRMELFRTIENVQRSSFPLSITGLANGVYSARVDGDVGSGLRTFWIGEFTFGKLEKFLR